MKNNSLLFLLIIAFIFISIFIFWNISALPDKSKGIDAKQDALNSHEEFLSSNWDDEEISFYSDSADDTSLPEDVDELESDIIESSSAEHASEFNDTPPISGSFEEATPEISIGLKLKKDKGIYKYKITKQRQIGGLSVPVVTTVWFGNNYVSIVENEMHNISTEVFISANEAYMLNLEDNTADLLDKSAVNVPTPSFEGITYINTGVTSIGSVYYEYERYINTDNIPVDYLFIDGELKKAKIYTNDYDYEIIGIEITDDVSDGRSQLPDNLKIIDRR